MAQQVKTMELQIRHGHTDDKVLVVFPQPVANLQLTPEQAEAFIAAMRNSIERLKEHVAKKGGSGG